MSATAFSRSKLALLMIVLAGCAQKEARLPYYNTPDFMPHFLSAKRAVRDSITHTIKTFSATDQQGDLITENIINGKIHIANFFFTSCGSICPGMMHNMKIVSDAFRNDTAVVLLSFSVTPWIDSVSALKNYAAQMNVNNKQWHLLTGNKTATYTLARKSYFAEESLGFNKDSTEFLHTEHFLLVDRQKHIRGIYNGTLQLEMKQLINDIETLKREE